MGMEVNHLSCKLKEHDESWRLLQNAYLVSRLPSGKQTTSPPWTPRVLSLSYATPKVTKYQRCNFIIQIHQITIKIDKINISLLFECVKIVEFNFNSHVFHVMYQETRYQEGRRQLLISFVSERDWNRKMCQSTLVCRRESKNLSEESFDQHKKELTHLELMWPQTCQHLTKNWGGDLRTR